MWFTEIDPGFPRQGAPTPVFMEKTYYLVSFLLKAAWKWKKLDRKEARVPLPHPAPINPPPGSTNDIDILFRHTNPCRSRRRYDSLGLFALEDEHHEEDDEHHEEESADSAAYDHRSPVLVFLLICKHNANTIVFKIEFTVLNKELNYKCCSIEISWSEAGVFLG